MTPMPQLINQSYRSATLVLRSNRLVLGDTIYRPDIAEGAVLDQLYNGKPIRAGQPVPQGSRISLVLGDGLRGAELSVPDLIGMPLTEAIEIINGSGLMVVPINDAGAVTIDSAAAIVYKQEPNGINELGLRNNIKQGDVITIYYKYNPDPVELEDNRRPDNALNKLNNTDDKPLDNSDNKNGASSVDRSKSSASTPPPPNRPANVQ